MKKITRCALAIGIIFSSCQKEEELSSRNWCSPTFENFDCNSPVMLGESGTVGFLPGDTDAQIVAKIKDVWNLSDDYVIWLDPQTYTGEGGTGTARNIDPEYLAFPLHISSMSDEWGHDYLEEYKQDKQAFLDKYTNGKETGGMKVCNL